MKKLILISLILFYPFINVGASQPSSAGHQQTKRTIKIPPKNNTPSRGHIRLRKRTTIRTDIYERKLYLIGQELAGGYLLFEHTDVTNPHRVYLLEQFIPDSSYGNGMSIGFLLHIIDFFPELVSGTDS